MVCKRRVSRISVVVSIATFAAASGIAQGQQRRADEVLADRIMVKVGTAQQLRPGVDQDGVTGIAELDAVVAQVHAKSVRHLFRVPPRGRRDPALATRIGIDRWLKVDLGGDRADHAELLARFRGLVSVEIAEADRVILPLTIPNDPDYSAKQWDFQPATTDAEDAWTLVNDASSHIVFAIDTGVEVTHSDLVNNLWTNTGEIPANGIDDDNNGFIDDIHGWNFFDDDDNLTDVGPHGTHVNGVMGAQGNNANMVAGSCWTARLAQAKVFGSGGFGTWDTGASGTTYAADNGGSVTNNSWGAASQGTQVYVDAMNYADGLDVLQVAAAGNGGNTLKQWPAAYAPMLSVASTNSSDSLSSFSTHGRWIDMAAPGENILSTWVGNSEATLSGTSMASPHVAGAGALVRTINPQLTNLQSRLTLRLMSDDLGVQGYDGSFGFGRLNVFKAVTAANAIRLSKTEAQGPDTVTISLGFPSEAKMIYVVLVSESGSVPGVALSAFDASDGRTFPLEVDHLTLFGLSVQPNPVLLNSIGTLDGAGAATATFNVLRGSLFKGQTISVCALTMDPANLTKVRLISAPTSFVVK